jgi:uncharacterized protein (TIGR02145 family)
VTTFFKIKNLAPLFLVVLLYGCPLKEVELPGDITGHVQDAVTGESVSDAEVQLFHTNDLIHADTTGMGGTFLFTNLEPASYSIEVRKDLYDIHRENLLVFSATTTDLDIKLEGDPEPEFSRRMLHYGLESTQLSFAISNSGGGVLSYEIIPTQDWISALPDNGNITQEPDHIVVTIQKEGLPEISHHAWVTIHSQLVDGIQVDSIEVYVNYVMDRDSILYRTTRIGNQVWMAENLNTGTMVISSGEDFPTSNDEIVEKLCYDNDPQNCKIYGGLYMWKEMMDYNPPDTEGIRRTQGICPDGWHIPTDQEWVILHNNLEEDRAGGMLKDTSELWWQPNVGATNETGFSALPAGKYEKHIGGGTISYKRGESLFLVNILRCFTTMESLCIESL